MDSFGYRECINLVSCASTTSSSRYTNRSRNTSRSPSTIISNSTDFMTSINDDYDKRQYSIRDDPDIALVRQDSSKSVSILSEYEQVLTACSETLKSSTNENEIRRTKNLMAHILQKQVIVMVNNAYDALASHKFNEAMEKFTAVKKKCRENGEKIKELLGYSSKKRDFVEKIGRLESALSKAQMRIHNKSKSNVTVTA